MDHDNNNHNALIFAAAFNEFEVYLGLPIKGFRKSNRGSRFYQTVFERLHDARAFCKENGYTAKDITVKWSPRFTKSSKKQKQDSFQEQTGVSTCQFDNLRCMCEVAGTIVEKIDILNKLGIFNYVSPDEINLVDIKDDPFCRKRFEMLKSKLNEVFKNIDAKRRQENESR